LSSVGRTFIYGEAGYASYGGSAFRANPYAYAGMEMSSAREHLFDLCHEYPGWAETPRDARANAAADILRLAETE